MLKEVAKNDYIKFIAHGDVHLIHKEILRDFLDAPRKPNKRVQNPLPNAKKLTNFKEGDFEKETP